MSLELSGPKAEHIFKRMKEECKLGDTILTRLANAAAEAANEALDGFPQGQPKPKPTDTVQVLMTERHARFFEDRCLGPHSELAGPLIFEPDDLPTYIIGVK